jgi:hypothetical protein
MTREVKTTGIRLLAAGFTLKLPIDTPYDRQLLAEHVSTLLRRHGAVRLSSGRRAWWLKLAAATRSAHCGLCLRPMPRAVHFGAGEIACIACAARAIATFQGASAKSAA